MGSSHTSRTWSPERSRAAHLSLIQAHPYNPYNPCNRMPPPTFKHPSIHIRQNPHEGLEMKSMLLAAMPVPHGALSGFVSDGGWGLLSEARDRPAIRGEKSMPLCSSGSRFRIPPEVRNSTTRLNESQPREAPWQPTPNL